MAPARSQIQQRIADQKEAPKGGINWVIHELREAQSTNVLLMERARAGEAQGTVLVADHQTAGYGTRNRGWFSKPSAGISMSMLLRPEMSLMNASQITLLSAVAVLDALHQIGAKGAQVKWPNDILIGGRKLCGILAESCVNTEGDPDFVILGIGLNVSLREDEFPEELRSIATSLFEAGCGGVCRKQLVEAILSNFALWWSRWCEEGFDPVAKAWVAQSCTLGRTVEFEIPDFSGVGDIVGLGPDGCLLIRERGGRTCRFYSGEMRYIDVPQTELDHTRSIS